MLNAKPSGLLELGGHCNGVALLELVAVSADVELTGVHGIPCQAPAPAVRIGDESDLRPDVLTASLRSDRVNTFTAIAAPVAELLLVTHELQPELAAG